MKKVILIILLRLIIPNATFAQSTSINKKVKYYKTWIYQHKDTLLVKGFLYELKDSSIVVLNKFIDMNQEIKPDNITEIPIKNIEIIKTRNKKGISTGIVAGIFSGLGIGLIVGSAIYKPQNSSQTLEEIDKGATVIASGIFSALLGGGIGAIAGTAKSSYKINRNWNDYMLNARSMLKKSIKFQLQN
jgi:hypothetical protein